MKFRLSINESDNKVIFQQQNYVDVQNDVINVRHSLSENITYEFAYTGNIVQFQIPLSGTYKIEAWGARGGSGSSSTGPLGAYSKSYVFLNKDERIKILVGEKGYQGCNAGNHIHEGGGGGGTFIAKDRTPLCVAGGGGSFTYYSFSTVQSHACGQATQLSANIGNGQASLKMGGLGGKNVGGGGGFDGNGGDGSGSYGKGGYPFISGGARQTSGTAYGTNPWAYGGFGGGGSGCGGCAASGGGGGGYTGGSTSNSNSNQGGGGGSYFEGSYYHESSFAISGCNVSLPTNPGTNGNGFAKLTLLIIPVRTPNKFASCSHYKSPIVWTFYAILLSK